MLVKGLENLCNETVLKMGKHLLERTSFEYYHVTKDPIDYNIEAKINDYEVHVTVDPNGNVVDFSCNCNARDKSIPCNHIAAALLQFQKLSEKDITINEKKRETLLLEDKFERTENIVANFTALENTTSLSIVSDVVLRCKALLYEDFISLSYEIGRDKFYAIKDLNEFIEQYKNHDYVVFGKNLALKLSSEVFDESSLSQIRFILENDDHISGKTLDIDDSNIDDFFNFYEGTNVIDLDFTTGDKQDLSVDVHRYEGYYKVSLKNDDSIIYGKEYAYRLLKDDRVVMRYSARFSESTKLLTETLRLDDLYVKDDHMYEVAKYMIQPANEFVDVEGYDKIVDKPYELNTKTFIDLSNEGDLLLQINTNVPEDKTLEELEQEGLLPLDYIRVKEIVSQYMDLDDNNIYTIKGNDNRVRSFINEQIPVLQKYGDVYVSDALKKVKNAKKAKVNVGVKCESDLLKMDVSSSQMSKDEISKVLNAYRKKRTFYKLKNGELLDLSDESLSRLDSLLRDLNIKDDALSDTITLPASKAYYLDGQEIERDESFKELIDNFNVEDVNEIDIPAPYDTILRDYQKYGFRWLRMMHDYNFGAILADDMGLGKTLQVIALLDSLRDDTRTSIVICPATLVYNWEEEIHKFSTTLNVECITGDSDTRAAIIGNAKAYDVVITSYDYLRRDVDLYKDIEFYYAIIDEAQYIKNQSTKNAKSVKSINALHHLALSGTPIENSLAELWSLFDFIMPGYLYNYDYFNTNFEKPIVKDKNDDQNDKLRRLVQPFILRRMKSDVLKELPERNENVIKLPFSDEERDLYNANALDAKDKMKADINKIQILALLTQLRQLCIDPRLLYEDIDHPSTKVNMCIEQIEKSIENNRKVLVFSAFTSALALVEQELNIKGISYFKLTGDTSKETRKQYVDSFKSDDTKVFLISLKAGGTGLNLVSASVVIHIDPWWNSSAQSQASDRVYRIGQNQSVEIYKFIMKDSIEERIMDLQKSKKELSDMLIENNEFNLSSMSKEDILNLFK